MRLISHACLFASSRKNVTYERWHSLSLEIILKIWGTMSHPPCGKMALWFESRMSLMNQMILYAHLKLRFCSHCPIPSVYRGNKTWVILDMKSNTTKRWGTANVKKFQEDPKGRKLYKLFNRMKQKMKKSKDSGTLRYDWINNLPLKIHEEYWRSFVNSILNQKESMRNEKERMALIKNNWRIYVRRKITTTEKIYHRI